MGRHTLCQQIVGGSPDPSIVSLLSYPLLLPIVSISKIIMTTLDTEAVREAYDDVRSDNTDTNW